MEAMGCVQQRFHTYESMGTPLPAVPGQIRPCMMSKLQCQCAVFRLFHSSFGWEINLLQRTYNSPQMAAKLCALNLFLGRDSELRLYHGSFLLMDNKHIKLFVNKAIKTVQIYA